MKTCQFCHATFPDDHICGPCSFAASIAVIHPDLPITIMGHGDWDAIAFAHAVGFNDEQIGTLQEAWHNAREVNYAY